MPVTMNSVPSSQIGQQISAERQVMSFAELKKYLAEKLKASKRKPLGR
jgi:hypothetical protein